MINLMGILSDISSAHFFKHQYYVILMHYIELVVIQTSNLLSMSNDSFYEINIAQIKITILSSNLCRAILKN